METLVQLWNEWEIHLLVLLSFALQLFLFFAGSFRPRNTITFVRLSIWFAYLGADFVAVYALGFLSRQQDNSTGEMNTLKETHQLAFFWAPFLLAHLGGQDTITAFAIEDNNLWLRHLLNLIVQVMLASYVFWKSTGWHNLQILVPGIFMFVSGIIKYGERTYALKCGSLKNTEGLPPRGNEKQPPDLRQDDMYLGVVGFALRSAPVVRNFFAGCNLVQFMATNVDYMCLFGELDGRQLLLKIEIGMLYDDLYSKAMVLRKRIGLILRCISQISAVVAFVLFIVSNKQRYRRADIAVTYVLFIGGFLVEFCAIAVVVMSPWTWGWLESRKCHKLARICWLLLSNNIRRLEKRMMWPNSMGQYNILNYVGFDQSWLSKQIQMLIRMTANIFGAGKERHLWVSKLLDSKSIQVDREILQSVTQYVDGVHSELTSDGSGRPYHQWPNLHPLLEKLQSLSMDDFGLVIVFMHALTEVHLSTYNPPGDMAASIGVCRKLSNYMLYLLVTHPEMLPVTGSVETTLEYFVTKVTEYGDGGKDTIMRGIRKLLEDLMDLQAIQPNEDTLQEIRDFWLRLLLFAAGKSRGETHAAQLAVGGELLTLTWLLMAHLEMGDSWPLRIELGHAAGTMSPDIAYVFPNKSGSNP
ncbi:unnamed protein product [Urochloa decumbens]|uniref:DUF4220 domain-containing protein n=1 Tax=Urochloa decumbens TaxID=240449 RepID=A0ABC8VEA9_9POAL